MQATNFFFRERTWHLSFVNAESLHSHQTLEEKKMQVSFCILTYLFIILLIMYIQVSNELRRKNGRDQVRRGHHDWCTSKPHKIFFVSAFISTLGLQYVS